MVATNLNSRTWKADFFGVDPPATAEVVATGFEVGDHLSGGTACARQAWVLLDTQLSPSEVEGTYQTPFSFWLRGDDSISAQRTDGGMVLVERTELIPRGWDLRCH